MSIAINNKKVKSIKIGNTNITKVYIGDKYVWPDISYVFTASKTTFQVNQSTEYQESITINSKVIRNGVTKDETFSIKQNGNFSTIIDSSDENAPSEDWVIYVSNNQGSERTDTIVLVQDNSGLTINITVTQIADTSVFTYSDGKLINAWYPRWNYDKSIIVSLNNHLSSDYDAGDISITGATLATDLTGSTNSKLVFNFLTNTTGSYREDKITITQQNTGKQIFAIVGQFADLGLGIDAITEPAVYTSKGYKILNFFKQNYIKVQYTTIKVVITGGNTASYDFKLEGHYNSDTQNGFKTEPLTTTLNSTTSTELQLVQVKVTNMGYVENEIGIVSLYCKLKTDSDSSENWKECGRCPVAVMI